LSLTAFGQKEDFINNIQKNIINLLKSLPSGRLGGSQQEKQTFYIIKDKIDSIGFISRFQKFSCKSFIIKKEKLIIKKNGKEISIKCAGIGFSNNTYPNTTSGEIILLNNNATHLPQKVRGKIIICTKSTRSKMYADFLEKGAQGFIEISDPGCGIRSTQLKGEYIDLPNNIPGVSVSYNNGITITKMLPAQATIILHQVIQFSESMNLIVNINGHSMPDEKIIIGAHVDTVQNTKGACDNGSGVVTLLEILRRLRNFKSDRSLIFIWFGCEEYGWKGSSYFMSQCDTISEIKLMINLDSLGGYIENNEVKISGTEKIYSHFIDFVKQKHYCCCVKRERGTGDDIVFSQKNINTICFHKGTPYIHTNKDNLNTIDAAALLTTSIFLTKYLKEIANKNIKF